MTRFSSGGVSVFVMLFGTVASLIVGSIVMLASMQVDNAIRTNAYEQALSVAEAGAHYYRWHLAHNPDDYTDGTGQPGPYVHDYKDPEGNVVGSFSLAITAPPPGSTIVTIKSTGWVKERPNVKRTVAVQLGIPSLARYAFLHNSSVWFGAGVQVHGPVMSNGGIRQDGTNDSLLQSSLSTYTCGKETGCNPSTTKPAVWGSGGSQSLWSFPVPSVDFDSVSISYPTMKADAQSIGIYYGQSDKLGYHVIFRANGTADVYRVTKAKNVKGIDIDGKCTSLPEEIQTEEFIANHALANKHILFFEDVVWVEGTITGRVTLVAARFPIDSNNMDIWINGNTVYAVKDGTVALGLISQRNIFFIQDLPDDFELDAALMAQNGSVFRHGYHVPSCNNNGHAIRQTFTMYGSLISGQPSAWNWGTPPGSGFVNRVITHDNHLYLNPPPYFPVSPAESHQFTSWNEDSN